MVLGGLFFLWAISIDNKNDILLDEQGQSVKNLQEDRQQIINIQNNRNILFDINKKIPKISNDFSKTSLPQLNGIMFSSVNPTAVLNDIIVSPGDTVSGFKVIKISPKSVEVSDNFNTFKLEL